MPAVDGWVAMTRNATDPAFSTDSGENGDSGVPMQFVFLQIAAEQVAVRLAQRRDHFMPAGLLDSQFAALQAPTDEADVISVAVEGTAEQMLVRVIAALSPLPSS